MRATSPWRVRNLLNKKPTGRNQGFIRKEGTQKILYVRKSKGKTKRQREASDYITPMYIVGVRRVRLNTNQFPFYRKGKKFVRKDFPKEFRKEMRAAIRTAR